MLTRILHNSAPLCTFIEQLQLELSQPQRRHMLNLADALLVWEDKKTLANLQRQFIAAPDASNMADFLRISPWQATAVRHTLRVSQMAWLLDAAERQGAAKILYINLDDSIGEKDKQTRHLEPVAWHYDHSESGKRRPRFKNGFCYLACTVCVGDLVATVDLRLYLREKTVRRLNRQRSKAERLAFRSKTRLAQSMLRELAPLLPKGWQVYVQFDSWYASERLIKFVRRRGWHVTCGLKSNRKLNGKRLDQIAYALRHQRYMRMRMTAVAGRQSTYYLRQTQGRLVGLPFDVHIYFTRRHPREPSLAYFMSTDLTRSAQTALQGYRRRWSCEVDNFYLKTQLGLTDFRVQSYTAVDKYLVVVFLTWAYVERRFVDERSPQIRTYGDLIRRHRDEHAEAWLTGALEMFKHTQDLQLVLQRFLRQPA